MQCRRIYIYISVNYGKKCAISGLIYIQITCIFKKNFRGASILFDHMTKCSFIASANERTAFDQGIFQSMWLTGNPRLPVNHKFLHKCQKSLMFLSGATDQWECFLCSVYKITKLKNALNELFLYIIHFWINHAF